MDLASILGLVICFVLCIFGIVVGDAGWAALKNFLDAPSALITFGGSFFCVLAAVELPYEMPGYLAIWGEIRYNA